MDVFRAVIFAVSALSALAASAQRSQSVPHEVYKPTQLKSAASFDRTMERSRAGGRERALWLVPYSLPPLDAQEEADLRRGMDKRHIRKIGLNRDLDRFLDRLPGTADFTWRTDQRGADLGILAVRSEGAVALRTRLVLDALPTGAELRIWGSRDDSLGVRVLTAEDLRARGASVWSPATSGDTQYIELAMPAAYIPPGPVEAPPRLNVVEVSHLLIAPALAPEEQRDLIDLGASQSCNVDVRCQSSTLTRQMADATVKMVYTERGATFLCSATLLADTDSSSFVPYLYTAAHCIDSQAAASTLEIYWFFESSFCNSRSAGTFSSRFGGAQLLYADAASDVSLLRLNEQPPAGAVFSGWDPAALPVFSGVTHTHHPSGDLKRVSFGSVIGLGEPNRPSGTRYYRVGWNQGITESGSSGGGLFTRTSSSFHLRGGLWGGSSSCATPNGDDLFSRFDLAYPQLETYLDPQLAFTPRDGKWSGPAGSDHSLYIKITGNELVLVGNLEDAAGGSGWVSTRGVMGSTSSYSGVLKRYQPGRAATGGMGVPARLIPIGSVTLQFNSADAAVLNWRGGSLSLTADAQ